jgi:signal recognition particle GTPase
MRRAKRSRFKNFLANERRPWLWLLAGPNGAGKSTYAPNLAADVEEIVKTR